MGPRGVLQTGIVIPFLQPGPLARYTGPMEPRGYQQRTLAGVLGTARSRFPGLVVTGPRQSGKTTLVRRLFGDTHRFCSLDEPAVCPRAQVDPGLVLARFPPPVILDEIQSAPTLLSLVKRDIDEHRAERGRYVITGSQVFALMQGVTESLAGRAAITSLLSFSLREASGHPDLQTSWNEALYSGAPLDGVTPAAMAENLLRDGYPDAALDPDPDVHLWHASYVQTYLERDVRSLRAVGDLADFQRFLVALAARTGGLLNFQDLGRDLGVHAKTAKAWVSVLEASGQVLVLKPYHANLGKRLVKRPKVYLLDTGTLAYLLGVSDPRQLLAGVAAGPVFEAAVLAQLHRLFLHRGLPSRLHFWRTAAGHEVDFVLEDGRTLVPIEAKLTTSPDRRDAASIEEFQRLFGRRASKGLVVCLCAERFPLTRNVDAVPLGAF